MPYKLVWATDPTMHCHFFGKVGFGDLTHATNDFYNDIRVDRTRFAVWDFSEMGEFVVGQHESLEMAATDFAASAYLKSLKAAFITNDLPDFFGPLILGERPPVRWLINKIS